MAAWRVPGPRHRSRALEHSHGEDLGVAAGEGSGQPAFQTLPGRHRGEGLVFLEARVQQRITRVFGYE